MLRPNIPIHSTDKPTILFTTAGACGTGMNGLVAANWILLMDIPFKLYLVKQCIGHVQQPGQCYEAHVAVLEAKDNPGEVLLYDRLKQLGNLCMVSET